MDTTLSGNGGPGPYALGTIFIDTTTIAITFSDTTLTPQWTYVPSRNAILFSQAIDSGQSFRVRFLTAFYGVPKLFSLYPKIIMGPNDTLLTLDTAKRALLSDARQENLTVTGYKSIGVSVGSFGEVNLEQGLDIRIGGEIKPQTALSAHLSDQGSSLDGATREISDFDLIYIGLKDPSYQAIAGDQYVEWPFKGLLSGQKKIKGLSFLYSPSSRPFSAGAFGALSGGQQTIETKQGRTGVQGPYYLLGKGEHEFIQPVSGTVKVRVNSRECQEGADKDFSVDYELGTITFTPKVLIKNEDLIRIEYEYKLFYYQRTLLGTTAGASGKDSAFTASGVLWTESDNKNHPIDLVLDTAQVNALERAGDKVPYASSARRVHPNDVAGESQVYPLYKKRYDAASRDSVFAYAPYNVNRPDSVLGYYYVWFRKITTGETGAYRVASVDQRGPIYAYAPGDPASVYTDRSPIPTPERRTSGEMATSVRLNGFTASLDIAGQDRDRNLFSLLDDRDNQASATAAAFCAGKKSFTERSAWLAGSHRYTSSRFDAEALSAHDRRESWDDKTPALFAAERQQWTAEAGATIIPGLSPTFAYGQERIGRDLSTDKIVPGLRYAPNSLFTFDYSGSFFRHLLGREKGSGRRESGSGRYALPRHALGLLYRDEWRSDSLAKGSGLFEGGLSYDFLPLALHQQVSYMARAKSAAGRTLPLDTGYSLRSETSFDHSLLPAWRLTASGSFDRSVNYGFDKNTTLLVDLVSAVSPERSGFESRQHYRTSSENASSFIQIPVFAGKGMGTHIYDSVRREYVPSPRGDFFMQQKEIYDAGSSLRVKKSTADITWGYRPEGRLPGILNDLSWNGALFCEEQVDASRTDLPSWLPGYFSLSALAADNFSGDPVHYADLSYRQDIDWSPRDSSVPLAARFFVVPAYRKIRSYRESWLETRLELEHVRGHLTLSAAVNLLSLTHTDTSTTSGSRKGYDFSLSDRRFELSQKYELTKGLFLSLLEAAGFARKDDGAPTTLPPLPIDSTLYYQLAPSVSWRPFEKGSVLALYTWSVVPFPGELDYRVARGFESGVSHLVSITADVKAGERLLIIGTYKGDLRKASGAAGFGPANHVFSLEVRAFM